MRMPIADYAPSPIRIVHKMLEFSRIKKGEMLYDIGSGDGRVVVEAARIYGVNCKGIEINPKLAEISRNKGDRLGLADLVGIVNGDIFDFDLRDADVVTGYLSPLAMELIEPKIFSELKPTARFVSHDYGFPNYRSSELHLIWARSAYFPWIPFPVGHFVDVYRMINVRERKKLSNLSKVIEKEVRTAKKLNGKTPL